MIPHDDDLARFETDGALPFPEAVASGHVEHDGARIYYASFGAGPPIVVLHGAFGNTENFGYQVPALLDGGFRAILIDSRGHGRSTRDDRPFRYDHMATDVLAVMDALRLETATLVGWSDGATISLMLAMQQPHRVSGVFFFACNMDPSGANQILAPLPILNRIFSRHARDYARLSATPDRFDDFSKAVNLMMDTQPNCTAEELAAIRVPVAIVQSEHDEFIKPEHAEYLARTIPGAKLIQLPGVSHFAPLQRPDVFNAAMLSFASEVAALPKK